MSSALMPSMTQAAGLAAVMRPSWVQKNTPSELCSNTTR